MKKAHRDGCRVVLKGQYGNATISWGKALSVFYQLFCSGHPRIALRTMKDFGHRYGIPRKYMLKCILTEWIGNLFPAKPEDPLTAPGLMQRYHISRAYRKQMRSAGGGEMDSREKTSVFYLQSYRANAAWDVRYSHESDPRSIDPRSLQGQKDHRTMLQSPGGM